jgi:hypothetical protein
MSTILLVAVELVSKMNLREIGSENGRWMELAQDLVHWLALVLAVLNILVLLPESYFVIHIFSERLVAC